MTLLLVVMDQTTGRRQVCDSRCHNATHQGCECPCGGRYHGLQEGTAALHHAVDVEQEQLLLDLGAREATGELWLEVFRPAWGRPLQVRPIHRAHVYQEDLFEEPWR